jgi:hypothetical protein
VLPCPKGLSCRVSPSEDLHDNFQVGICKPKKGKDYYMEASYNKPTERKGCGKTFLPCFNHSISVEALFVFPQNMYTPDFIPEIKTKSSDISTFYSYQLKKKVMNLCIIEKNKTPTLGVEK